MKRILFFSMVALALVACQKQTNVIIDIQADSSLQAMAYICNLADKGTMVDSVMITNGVAHWQTTSAVGEVYRLSIPDIRFRDEFIGDQGTVMVDLTGDGTITGTPLNDSLHQLFTRLEDAPNEAAVATIISDAIVLHTNDALGSLLLYYLDMFVEQEEAEAAFDLLEEGAKQPGLTQKILENWAIVKHSAVGQPYIDIEVEYNGETQRLSDYIGGKNRLTIVDFWASWCGPCKRELPFLIDVYQRYKDQGVEVLGVATWDAPEASLKAIEEHGIPYPQILNAQSIGSDAYGIKGIPEILMIDADGIILARGLRGTAIEEAVLLHLQD